MKFRVILAQMPTKSGIPRVTWPEKQFYPEFVQYIPSTIHLLTFTLLISLHFSFLVIAGVSLVHCWTYEDQSKLPHCLTYASADADCRDDLF